MTIQSAQDVAAVFNQQNEKTSWKATCVGELVHFSATNGMVSLVYDALTGRFQVKFNKFQGAFGDYMQAIRRSLYSILHTLKSGGLPFDCAPTFEEMNIVLRILVPDGDVFCEWEGGPHVFNWTRMGYQIEDGVMTPFTETVSPDPLPPII